MASAELLGTELKEERARGLWERSGRALSNLNLRIEELLLFSGLLKGDIKISREPCDLRTILEASARSLDFLYNELGVSLELSAEGTPVPVPADPEMMAAVFRQLLSNAAKFCSRGGSVSVRAGSRADKVLFHFADTGCGVSDEAMPRIFDGFFQAADYLTRSAGGIGLGLATVKHIVEAHGGRVTARKNTPAPGMTFTVMLPAPANKPAPGGIGRVKYAAPVVRRRPQLLSAPAAW